eukprot:11194153-Lingulodinium_polyedra.AAC.1
MCSRPSPSRSSKGGPRSSLARARATSGGDIAGPKPAGVCGVGAGVSCLGPISRGRAGVSWGEKTS